MEVGVQEFLGLSGDDDSQIAKGKRTKRLRLQSPNDGTCSSSSTADHDAGDCGSFSSTAICNYENTEDEEDMANCLILLAQGDSQKQTAEEGCNKTDKFSSRRFANITTTSPACKTGIFVYECKTCNRAFPSFQALGGHRASHKKTKVDEKKLSPAATTTLLSNEDRENLDSIKINAASPTRSTPVRLIADMSTEINLNRAKIHECSICGSEFSSGQALGGHMRRHRAATSTGPMVGLNVSGNSTTGATPMKNKSRNTLELDLNLPAPEDNNRDSKFQFASTQRSLVLSAPALVDCHY